MTPDEFQTLLRERPFTPMRLHITPMRLHMRNGRGNGRTLDIRHPEMATVGGELAAVSESQVDGGTRLRVVSLINIDEVEFLPSATI